MIGRLVRVPPFELKGREPRPVTEDGYYIVVALTDVYVSPGGYRVVDVLYEGEIRKGIPEYSVMWM
jgi:glutaredoxin-related protein